MKENKELSKKHVPISETNDCGQETRFKKDYNQEWTK